MYNQLHKVFDKRIYVFMVLFALLFAFDYLALQLYLYWTYRWIDVPVHFVGGFFLGALLFYLVFSNKATKRLVRLPRTNQNIIFVSVIMVFIAALGWEVLEFAAGRTRISPAYWPDTLLDLFAGTAGGYCFHLFYKSIREMITSGE